MISEVVMPQMGADMTEGTLLRWLKQEGEQVQRGEIIAEIETDKANVEIEAFGSGVFRKTLAGEGDTVQVGEVIAVIAGPDDDISKYGANGASAGGATKQAPAEQRAAAGAAPPAEPQPAGDRREAAPTADTGAPQAQATPASDTPPAPAPPSERPQPVPGVEASSPEQEPPPQPAPSTDGADGRVRASPLAKRIADERGIDLRGVQGSGPGGRIVRRDVEGLTAGGRPAPAQAAPAQAAPAPATAAPERPAAPPQQAPAGDTVLERSRMRQAIARRMSQSKREAPHYYLLIDVDMTDAMAFRAQANESLDEGSRLTVNDLLVRAAVLALQRHPRFNVTIEGDRATQHAVQHVCIGIALEEGLIAPAIVNTSAMSLPQIAVASKDLVERARNGRLRADEMTAGTFTISNLGAYGVETLVAIIQPPQTAILGVGAVAPQAAVREGNVQVRQLMKLALSADHRVTDGAEGARFLAEIKRFLERPLLLVL